MPKLAVIGRGLGRRCSPRRRSTSTCRRPRARSATALVIGGAAGLLVGLVLGAQPLPGACLRALSPLPGADAQDHLLPDHDHVVRHGPRLARSPWARCRASSPWRSAWRPGMRQIDQVLIRVGRSFRANPGADGAARSICRPCASRWSTASGWARRWPSSASAGRDQAVQPRAWLHGDRQLFPLRHAGACMPSSS